jgi:hypothetical protein
MIQNKLIHDKYRNKLWHKNKLKWYNKLMKRKEREIKKICTWGRFPVG